MRGCRCLGTKIFEALGYGDHLLNPQGHGHVLQLAVAPQNHAQNHNVYTDLQFAAQKLDMHWAWKVKVYQMSLQEEHWQRLDAGSALIPFLELQQLTHDEGSQRPVESWLWRGSLCEAESRKLIADSKKRKRKMTQSRQPGAKQR